MPTSDRLQVASSGYQHPAYAAALAEFGEPRHLEASNSWILQRPVAHSRYRDAMGLYPLLLCSDWSALREDLNGIDDLVSVVAVTDPFGEYSPELLRSAFEDCVTTHKQHMTVDLTADLRTFVHPHHQRNARKGLQRLIIGRAAEPLSLRNEWNALYGELIERHAIRGLPRFSETSFEQQLRVPGLVLFYAKYQERIAGITLWFASGDKCYYHLAAYNELGYAHFASFAMFWEALTFFGQSGVRYVTLGAAAGARAGVPDGLTRFKQGWANGAQTTYLCGQILNRPEYQRLSELHGATGASYFPAYRENEFS